MEFNNFGVLIDCAGCGIMNVESVKDFIDKISLMGYNLLELCMNDIYHIDDEPYFGYLRGAYSNEEIKEMDAYAKSKGVELVPCIQTLAHFPHLQKFPTFAERGILDIDDIMLVDEPKTYDLIEKMFKALSETFTSRKINIGFDEAFKVGLGKYLELHGYTDRIELLLRHLNKVVEIADKYGFTIHMWSDMFFRMAGAPGYWEKGIKIPDVVREKIPKSVELCYWDYYRDDEEMYDEMMKSHEGFGCEIWFAGGAWTWNGYAPFNKWSMRSMKPAMRQARNHNVKNILVTIWGDDGKDCSYFSVLPSMYALKRYAEGEYDDEVIKKEFDELFDLKFDDFMLLDLPNKTELNPKMEEADNVAKVLLYNDCFLGLRDKDLSEIEHIPFDEYATQLAEAAERSGEYRHIFDELSSLCNVLDLKAELGLRSRDAYMNRDDAALRLLVKDYHETVERLDDFRNKAQVAWMHENKPYGWEIHEIRIGGLRARLLDCARRLEEYANDKSKTIPELEEEKLTFSPIGKQMNFYKRFISVNDI